MLQGKVTVQATPPAATASDPNPSHFSAEGQAGGEIRDTRGGGSSWGQPL